MADLFAVIADATRRDLLGALLDHYASGASRSGVSESGDPGSGASGPGELSVGEIVERLGLSQPTVSKHLRVLRESGLVTVRELGQHRYYSLDPAPLEAIEDWLAPFLGSDFDSENDGGSTVFTAWSGANVPASLRRAADSLQHSGEAGESIGRVVAGASHQARSVIEDATAGVQHRVIQPIRKVLKK